MHWTLKFGGEIENTLFVSWLSQYSSSVLFQASPVCCWLLDFSPVFQWDLSRFYTNFSGDVAVVGWNECSVLLSSVNENRLNHQLLMTAYHVLVFKFQSSLSFSVNFQLFWCGHQPLCLNGKECCGGEATSAVNLSEVNLESPASVVPLPPPGIGLLPLAPFLVQSLDCSVVPPGAGEVCHVPSLLFDDGLVKVNMMLNVHRNHKAC